jgi:hypothetical protein
MKRKVFYKDKPQKKDRKYIKVPITIEESKPNTTVINSAFVPVQEITDRCETVMRFGFFMFQKKYLQIILTIIWVKVLVVM